MRKLHQDAAQHSRKLNLSQLHKFLFDHGRVRGLVVKLDEAWQHMLARRDYPPAVRALLGEMAAAAVLMQANIKFNGALVMQIFGEGPVKLAVVEVQPDLSLRATVKLVGSVAPEASFAELVNQRSGGRCAITLDPKDKQPGQQPYQGVVPLGDEHNQPLQSMAQVIEQYMRQSEQLDTCMVLSATAKVAAGLMIQRLPQGGGLAQKAEHEAQAHEDFNRIAHLTRTLTSPELVELDVDTLLHRLYWQESHQRFEPLYPRFACNCSRERVSSMLRSLGLEEVESILQEQGQISVDCEFCGAQYVFDPIEGRQLFAAPQDHLPAPKTLQ
jgi:molecular chaperone Hsp33